MVDGKYHGIGTYTFKSCGKSYAGKFKNNQISGKGAMVWDNGTIYAGQFVKGRIEGMCTKTINI